MSAYWNLQNAKAKLSELVDRAGAGQPQIILRRGTPAAAVISLEDYKRLRPRTPLISFFLNSPHAGSGLQIPHLDDEYEPRTDLFEEDPE